MLNLEGYTQDVISIIGRYLEEKGITRYNPVDNTGAEYENEVFLIRAYDWRDPEDESDEYNLPNFWYKPLNYQVEWYKHLGRGTYTNRPLTIDEALSILDDCIASLQGAAVIKAADSDDFFWEAEDIDE